MVKFNNLPLLKRLNVFLYRIDMTLGISRSQIEEELQAIIGERVQFLLYRKIKRLRLTMAVLFEQ